MLLKEIRKKRLRLFTLLMMWRGASRVGDKMLLGSRPGHNISKICECFWSVAVDSRICSSLGLVRKRYVYTF